MEQNQIPEKDRIITNLIFRLGDILYSLMYENLEAMNKLGFDLKGQTKLRFQKITKRKQLQSTPFTTLHLCLDFSDRNRMVC